MRRRGKRELAALLTVALLAGSAACGADAGEKDAATGTAEAAAGQDTETAAGQGTDAQAGAQENLEETALSLMREVNPAEAAGTDDLYRSWYEVFVYSFYDGDGDGIGDLPGLTEKLDYINDGNPATDTDLGCDGIWLMPVMPATTYHKYDVTDYCAIDEQYGTMEDFETFVNACHERGIRVMIDFVMNHTSSQHPWFQTAAEYLKDLPEGMEPDTEACPYVDYYHFSREKGSGYCQLAGTDWYYEAQFWSEMPDLNLEIGDGELFTLLGPSGCGKTTLLRMIAGFNSIEGGDIFFNEKRINDMDPSKRNIGMVFQNYAIFPNLSVRDNVAFGLKNRKVDKAEIKKRTDEFLNLMQIMQYADRMPNQLSGGQQQRIALARALVISPDVLLMDEPLSNLDAKLRVEMRSVIRHTQKSVGITTVYVTHDQEEAMAISDRIAVMKDGVIQHVGTPRDIYQRPKNVFVATFIGRTNIVNAHVKGGVITFADGYHEHIDALDKAAEQEVRCSIRPEEFIICKDGTEGIHGTVQECTYLGLNTHYTIDTDQGDSVEIVEESSIGEGLKKGEKVLLKVKKEKINVFTKDGDTNLIRSDAYEKQ